MVLQLLVDRPRLVLVDDCNTASSKVVVLQTSFMAKHSYLANGDQQGHAHLQGAWCMRHAVCYVVDLCCSRVPLATWNSALRCSHICKHSGGCCIRPLWRCLMLCVSLHAITPGFVGVWLSQISVCSCRMENSTEKLVMMVGGGRGDRQEAIGKRMLVGQGLRLTTQGPRTRALQPPMVLSPPIFSSRLGCQWSMLFQFTGVRWMSSCNVATA